LNLWNLRNLRITSSSVSGFKVLKPLFEFGHTERTFSKLAKHPSTIYRWIEDYERAERLSVFLRKERSDRGKSRLPSKVNAIIETAIDKIYLTAEQPNVGADIEEVQLQCFKANAVGAPSPRLLGRRRFGQR